MFGLGFGEILVIALIALVFVGPKRLPEAGRKIGEFYRQLRDAADTVKSTVTQDFETKPVSKQPSSPADSGDDTHHGAD